MAATSSGRCAPSSRDGRAGRRPTATSRGRLPTAARSRPDRRCDPTPAHPPGTEQSREVHHRCSPPAPRSAPADVVVRAAIVALDPGTAYIHSTLGGLLFTLNAVGYVVAAVAMVIPLALAVRFRWVVRVGLMGYAATAIVAWAIMGPYYSAPPTSPRPSRSR